VVNLGHVFGIGKGLDWARIGVVRSLTHKGIREFCTPEFVRP
jgi:hypothetical protein